MGSSILGALTGGLLGAFDSYQEKRQNDKAEDLAKRQAEEQRRAQQDEEQARRRAEKNGPDVSGLLADNTQAGLGSSTLTGVGGAAVDPSRLSRGNTLLGG